MEKDAMNSAQVQHAIRRADANCAMVQKYRVLQRLQRSEENVWNSWQRRSLDRAASSYDGDSTSNTAPANSYRSTLSTSPPRQYHRMNGSDKGSASRSTKSSSRNDSMNRSYSNIQNEAPSRPPTAVQFAESTRSNGTARANYFSGTKSTAVTRNRNSSADHLRDQNEAPLRPHQSTQNGNGTTHKQPPAMPGAVEVAAAAAAVMAHASPPTDTCSKTMTPGAAAQVAGQLAAAASAMLAWGAEEWAALAAANRTLQAAWAQLGAKGVDLGDVYIASLASSLLGSSAAPGFPNLFRADTTTLGSSCLDIPAEDTMTTAAGTAGVDMETGEGREVQREGKKVGNEGHISSVQERSFEAELDAARQARVLAEQESRNLRATIASLEAKLAACSQESSQNQTSTATTKASAATETGAVETSEARSADPNLSVANQAAWSDGLIASSTTSLQEAPMVQTGPFDAVTHRSGASRADDELAGSCARWERSCDENGFRKQMAHETKPTSEDYASQPVASTVIAASGNSAEDNLVEGFQQEVDVFSSGLVESSDSEDDNASSQSTNDLTDSAAIVEAPSPRKNIASLSAEDTASLIEIMAELKELRSAVSQATADTATPAGSSTGADFASASTASTVEGIGAQENFASNESTATSERIGQISLEVPNHPRVDVVSATCISAATTATPASFQEFDEDNGSKYLRLPAEDQNSSSEDAMMLANDLRPPPPPPPSLNPLSDRGSILTSNTGPESESSSQSQTQLPNSTMMLVPNPGGGGFTFAPAAVNPSSVASIDDQGSESVTREPGGVAPIDTEPEQSASSNTSPLQGTADASTTEASISVGVGGPGKNATEPMTTTSVNAHTAESPSDAQTVSQEETNHPIPNPTVDSSSSASPVADKLGALMRRQQEIRHLLQQPLSHSSPLPSSSTPSPSPSAASPTTHPSSLPTTTVTTSPISPPTLRAALPPSIDSSVLFKPLATGKADIPTESLNAPLSSPLPQSEPRHSSSLTPTSAAAQPLEVSPPPFDDKRAINKSSPSSQQQQKQQQQQQQQQQGALWSHHELQSSQLLSSSGVPEGYPTAEEDANYSSSGHSMSESSEQSSYSDEFDDAEYPLSSSSSASDATLAAAAWAAAEAAMAAVATAEMKTGL